VGYGRTRRSARPPESQGEAGTYMATDDVGFNSPFPADVHRDAKVAAAVTNRSLRQFVIDSVMKESAKVLAQREKEPHPGRKMGTLTGYNPG
jgi:hypothetical protein